MAEASRDKKKFYLSRFDGKAIIIYTFSADDLVGMSNLASGLVHESDVERRKTSSKFETFKRRFATEYCGNVSNMPLRQHSADLVL